MTVDWRPLAEAMANTLTEKGLARTPGLRRAFAAIPRHVFVPAYYRHQLSEGIVSWERVDESDPDWLSEIYTADETLPTQLRPWQDQPDSTVPTSSTTMPSTMADMIDELHLDAGMTVFESGTGSGYNAAILSNLLGEESVTTIDIDPELVYAARSRLAQVGYRPSFQPRANAFDRVLATHSVERIPAAWLLWTKPGGVILTDLRSTRMQTVGAWAKLTVTDAGTATGRVMPDRAAFMPARQRPEHAPGGLPAAPDIDLGRISERTTNLPTDVLTIPEFTFMLWRVMPEVAWGSTGNTTHLVRSDGQWTNVSNSTVEHGQPEDLWATVEDTYARWDAAGRPGFDSWRITVERDGDTMVSLQTA